MKCFTVAEEMSKGLRIRSHTVLGRHDPVLTIGDPGSLTNVPLSRELLNVFNGAVTSPEMLEEFPGLTELRLMRAEVSTNAPLRLIRERNPKSSCCLVHVATDNVGPLWFEANSYREEVVRGRVVRVYDPFPAPGIETVAWGMTSNGSPQGLFVMHPGSSFRICRQGDLQGASPRLIVAWPGSTLKCFAPAKYRQSAA